MTTPEPDHALSTPSLARYLGVSTRTLVRMRARGTGPNWFRLPSGHVRYPIHDVLNWIWERERQVHKPG